MINCFNFRNVCLILSVFFGLLSIYSSNLIIVSSLFIISTVVHMFDYNIGKKKEFETTIKDKLEYYEKNYDFIKKEYDEYKKEIEVIKSKVNMLSSFNRQL